MNVAASRRLGERTFMPNASRHFDCKAGPQISDPRAATMIPLLCPRCDPTPCRRAGASGMGTPCGEADGAVSATVRTDAIAPRRRREVQSQAGQAAHRVWMQLTSGPKTCGLGQSEISIPLCSVICGHAERHFAKYLTDKAILQQLGGLPLRQHLVVQPQ